MRGPPRRCEATGRRDPEPQPDLVRRSAPFLPAGSEIRQAFICQSAPNFFFVITYLTGLTLGPVSGRWGAMNLLGERHWVHKRFHDQIAAADREMGVAE
jgi:hypothetical protein